MNALQQTCPSVAELLAMDGVDYSDDPIAKVACDYLKVVDKVFSSTKKTRIAAAWYLFRKSWLAATNEGWMELGVNVSPGFETYRIEGFHWSLRILSTLLHSAATFSPNTDTVTLHTKLVGFSRSNSINVNEDEEVNLVSVKLDRFNGHSLLVTYSKTLFDEANRKYPNAMWNYLTKTIFDKRSKEPAQLSDHTKKRWLGGRD